jgi:hypothetical protein
MLQNEETLENFLLVRSSSTNYALPKYTKLSPSQAHAVAPLEVNYPDKLCTVESTLFMMFTRSYLSVAFAKMWSVNQEGDKYCTEDVYVTCVQEPE